MSDLWLCPGCNRWQPIDGADCPTCGSRCHWTVVALDPTAGRRGVAATEVNVTTDGPKAECQVCGQACPTCQRSDELKAGGVDAGAYSCPRCSGEVVLPVYLARVLPAGDAWRFCEWCVGPDLAPSREDVNRRADLFTAIASGSPDAPPQFKDHAVNITGGIESSEYVRGLRDDDEYDPTARPVEEVVAEIFKDVPKEEWDRLDAANRVCKTCGARCLHCNPPTPVEFTKALMAKTPEPTESAGQVLEEFSRNLHVHQDGTSGMAAIMGRWPGDETDEEIDEALKKLS
jgi:hypothetical protein